MSNEIGVIVRIQEEGPSFEHAAGFGLGVCQLSGWDPKLWTDERAGRLREESIKLGVRITAFWAGWPGPAVWDFVDGPRTIGLVPAAHRAARVAALRSAGPFAKRLGVAAVITHLGFIPEDPGDPVFRDVVEAVRELAAGYRQLGLEFWFETGQETPVTLLRLMQAAGAPNLGVNFDPANLILYGKAHPIDALDLLGPHVKNVHAKDGFYPTDPLKLGREVKVGAGKVRFPEFVRRLREFNFTGEFIIEREISGAQQRQDISETVEYLRQILAGT